MYRNKEKGFTLVELIVVLAILATLAAIMVPSLTGYIDKANDTKLISMAKSIHTAAQVEASEVYARGPYEIIGSTGKTAEGNYVSAKNIASNSELKDWGFPGEDWPKDTYEARYIYNGFGYKNHNDAKYHFKVLVSTDGKVTQLAVCSGDKIAILKDDGFQVKKKSCIHPDDHQNNRLYNFVFMGSDSKTINAYKRFIINE